MMTAASSTKIYVEIVVMMRCHCSKKREATTALSLMTVMCQRINSPVFLSLRIVLISRLIVERNGIFLEVIITQLRDMLCSAVAKRKSSHFCFQNLKKPMR